MVIVHFNEVNLFVHTRGSEWFMYVDLALFLALNFPLGVRRIGIMVIKYNSHMIPFVSTEFQYSSTGSFFRWRRLMAKRWLFIPLGRCPKFQPLFLFIVVSLIFVGIKFGNLMNITGSRKKHIPGQW